ncbi:MAG: helix-turn-helix protein [Frankiales bacterium]|nr:helix-turn-helix protein [Frankiales bacterium]
MPSTPPQPHPIAVLRGTRGWTQAALSAKTGIAKSTIARIEAGEQRPQIITAVRLASALDVPLDALNRPEERPQVFGPKTSTRQPGKAASREGGHRRHAPTQP